ncbi:acyltransferase [Aurantimonas sp. LRZ36]|uniref:Acyltransferase n=1 Tax=Aurantimonas marianensis TaxID=2920428 RepID=A0A9X2HC49_9HYPH|nr:acyltransferase [Aurantimonas marianensis]
MRALAVMAVLFFHAGFVTFSGGFAGVDVFFVISGFLITRLIVNEVHSTGTFRFGHFYVRRMRRLFPALLATLWLSFIGAAFLFAPQFLSRVGGALVAALFSVSNIYFWAESGYFDPDAILKPLLHTWSLGVEEQFYLVWPVLVVLAVRNRSRWIGPASIALAGLASFLFALDMADGRLAILDVMSGIGDAPRADGPAAVFFLAPFRVFEFAIGALCVWLGGGWKTPKLFAEALLAIGLLLIGLSVLLLDETAIFPSWNALLPCLGAACVILAGAPPVFGKVLTNPVMTGLGKVSYSLYLVHWPVIVFYGYWTFTPLSAGEGAGLIVVSILLAVPMFHLVERRFRLPGAEEVRSSVFLRQSALAATVSGLCWAGLWSSNGWLWRYPEEVQEQLSYEVEALNDYVWKRFLAEERSFDGSDRQKLLVVGDSMGADFVNILGEGGWAGSVDLATVPVLDNCKTLFPVSDAYYETYLPKMEESCRRQHATNLGRSIFAEADAIVVAFEWSESSADVLDEQLAVLRTLNPSAKIAVTARRILTGTGIEFFAHHGGKPNAHEIRTPYFEGNVAINRKLRALQGVTVIDLLQPLCNEDGCQRVTREGVLISYDLAHLTPKGAAYLGERLATMDWPAKFGLRQEAGH